MVSFLLIVFVMILGIPLATMLGGAALSALMGLLISDDADARSEGKAT